MAEHRPKPPSEPPTQADLLELFRQSVPEEYYAGLVDHPSFAVIRAIAQQWSALAGKLGMAVGGRYHKYSGLAFNSPATSSQFARGVVTLNRTANYERELVYNPGEFSIEVVGRQYVNESPIVWNPGDRGERPVVFRCVVPTALGNMDHIADELGYIDTELVTVVDRSGSRAGIDSSIIAGVPTVLQDAGVDNVFKPTDVGLYVKVTASSDTFNVDQYRKITGFTWPEIEYPVGTGRYPRRVFLDDSPRFNPVEVITFDGAVTYTEVTEASADETITDGVTNIVGAVDTALIVGSFSTFNALCVNITTPGEGDWTLTWEYSDGASGWLPLTVTDDTNGWRPLAAGDYTITFDNASDWLQDPSLVSSLNLYQIRARVSAHSSVTVQPEIGRVTVKQYMPLYADVQQANWALLNNETLGVAVVSCEAFAGGRDDDLQVLGSDRGLIRQPNETDEQFRQRLTTLLDAVTPAAIKRAVNAAMRPFGYTGDAIDVGNGLTGYFLDNDYLDYYESGDAYPEDPWLVPLSEEETRWFFLVLLPYLAAGEFGIFLDEGPVFLDEDHDEWLGSFLGFGFLDGFPVDAYAAFAGLWSTINKIKMGGIRFEMTRDLTLNSVTC